MQNNTTWSALKADATAKKSPIQFTENMDRIRVFYVDGGVEYYTLLWKTAAASGIPSTNTADLADFEANYRNDPNTNLAIDIRNDLGQTVQAVSAYAYANESTRFKGFLYAPPANTLSIYDEKISNSKIFVQGAEMIWADTPSLGDYMEFSVVDKDDVLGLFSSYGLTAGVDTLELIKYATTGYLPPRFFIRELLAKTAASVVGDLYIRMYYFNAHSTNIPNVSVDYRWYE